MFLHEEQCVFAKEAAFRVAKLSLPLNNLPIGSGVTEAACKTLIKQRLCQSGMKWKNQGISMVLHLRALISTKGRWEQFWVRINQAGLIGLAEIC
jgi:hypothetical protein